MAKYGVNYYGATKYGQTPKLAYSVEPMSLTVLSFSTAYISWQSPTGDFSRIRLVRNQNGIAEHSEDGIIVWEEFATEGNVTRVSFIDGVDNPTATPLSPGKPVYYTMFLFTGAKVWVTAGTINDVIPKDHNTQKKFMDILPRVFTSREQSPFAEVDTTSPLYSFIDGFSFTYDEFLTYIDLLRPSHTRYETPAALVYPETTNYGLTFEPGIATKYQKKLIREAIYMYSRKGTALGLGTYVESLTGFAPDITVSPNLLLTVQDSTFYNSVGNWTATAATLSAVTELVPDTTTVKQIDHAYTCKVVASGAGAMSLGNTTPVTKGVPVTPSIEYTMSCKLKSPSSAGNITMSIIFYDKDGVVTGSTVSATAVAANNTWKSSSKTFTTPADATYASIQIAYSAAGTYYIDEVCVQEGSTAAYEEARAINVFFNPNKTNYIKNPSFEVNVTDSWTKTGSATVTQDTSVSSSAYSGSKSAKVVGTGSWTYTSNQIPVVAGNYYTFSAFVKNSAALNVGILGRNGSGTQIEIHNSSFTANADWVRISVTTLVDALEVDLATYEVVFSGAAGTFYIDCVQFEKSQTATDYFDASLPSNYGAVWEGTANNSYTHLYYGKSLKVKRVAQTMKDWTPMNSWWRITSYAGLEYTNLTV